ncbi:hypothetical protein [Sediminibacillus terrae]|uniref:hypothetical protein n=1 Tax=Sediminibacillus terrae TaxID=1562106 RepID=UPI0004012424|nr:hypothetical protein [Sediminibacillus terrae]
MEKMMYGFGLFSFIAIMLHFWGYSHQYTQEMLVTGIVSFIIAGVLYFLFVFCYFRGGFGKKVVFWGLIAVIFLLLFLLGNGNDEKEHSSEDLITSSFL